MSWLWFIAGFFSGAGFFIGGGLLAGRWMQKRVLRRNGRRLPVPPGTEFRLNEALGDVARSMADVPESAVPSGVACRAEVGDQAFVVSVSREGKKTFTELFLEAAKERDAARDEATRLRRGIRELPIGTRAIDELLEGSES